VTFIGVTVPLFEYECRKCGHEFEALVIGTRQPVCPKCKSEDLEKRVSSLGFAGVGAGSFSRSSGGCGSTGGGG
jgi:putative FmdB family regulatory protein